VNTLLGRALDGVAPGAKILVIGRREFGADTLCAELLVQFVTTLPRRKHWMSASRQHGAIFQLVDHIPFGYARFAVVAPSPGCTPVAVWREILHNQMHRWEAHTVVDSLEQWTSGPAEEDALLQELATSPELGIALSYVDDPHVLRDRIERERFVDAVAIIKRDCIEVTKCTWAPGPRVVPRPPMTIQEVASRDEEKPQYRKGGTG